MPFIGDTHKNRHKARTQKRKGFFLGVFLVAGAFLFIYTLITHASGDVYYFNNAVNEDPGELGNYWTDEAMSIPASQLPNFSVDQVTVASGANFDNLGFGGQSIFNGTAINYGHVTGDATFNDSSQNQGTVDGSATFTGTAYDYVKSLAGTAGTTIYTHNVTFTVEDEWDIDLSSWTFQGTSSWIFTGSSNLNSTIPGDAVFNDSSSNKATIQGDATFNDSAINNGTVEGDAIFNGGNSGNSGGTVVGTKTRRYITNVTIELDFVTDGPWTVLADGATVNISGATYDNTTTLTTQNSGHIVDINLLPTRSYNYKQYVYLAYGASLDTGSVPAAGDFSVEVNGSPVSVSSVSISGPRVTLTLGTTTTEDDTVVVSYTAGSNPIKKASSAFNAPNISNQSLTFGIPVGTHPLYSTIVGNNLYVSNVYDDSVSVIDLTTNTVTATIAVGDAPQDINVVGNYLYVNNGDGGTLSVINLLTNTVTATIAAGSRPYHTTVVGTKLYVSNVYDHWNYIKVVNTANNTVTNTINVGDNPYYSTVVGNKLYVCNSESNNISVINTVTNTVSSTISIGAFPYYCITAGTKIYSNNGSSVSVVDTATNTVVATLNLSGVQYSTVAGNKIYIGYDSDKIAVVDMTTDTVVATITIGNLGQYMVTNGSRIYVTNRDSDTVSVIDTATDTVVDTIPVGDNPNFDSTSIENGKVYVSNADSNTISIINTNTVGSKLPSLQSFSSSATNGTYTAGSVIPITATFDRALHAGSTMTVALNSAASVVLNSVSGATLSGSYTVASGNATPDLHISSVTSANVIDATSTYTKTSYDLPTSQGSLVAENSAIVRNLGDAKNIVIGSYKTIATGSNPYQISPVIDGFMYVANQGDGTVSVINKNLGVVTDTITVGSEPYGITTATVSGTTYVYVANTGSNTVSVIDTDSKTVVATVSTGIKPYYATTIGTNVYVTNGQSNSVTVIDATTNTVSATIPVGIYPRGIKAHGTDLYVANYGDPNYGGGNSVSVIDSNTNTVSDVIPLPIGSSGPRGVTVLGSKVYVTNYRSNNVSVIDTATNTIEATISVGAGPRGILGTGSRIYVENFNAGTMSVINTSNNTVVATAYVGHSPAGMMLSGSEIYLTRFQDNEVSVFDTATNALEPEASEVEESSGGSTVSGGGQIPVQFIPAPVPLPLPIINQKPSEETLPKNTFLFKLVMRSGVKNEEVRQLQKYLNTNGFIVAKTGPGSFGKETNMFGRATRAALVKFQEAHASDILWPAGLKKGTGIFGAFTKAYVNSH